jgi:hypothetical protein
MFKRSTGLQYAPEYGPEKVNPNQLKGLISASYTSQPASVTISGFSYD